MFKKHYFLPFLVSLFLLPSIVNAHRPDQSYIFLDIYSDSLGVSYELLVSDLNKALGSNLPSGASEAEIKPILPIILAYYKENVKFYVDGKYYDLTFKDIDFFKVTSEKNYLILNYMLQTGKPTSDSIGIYYNVLLEKDVNHSGYAIIRNDWKSGVLNQEANIVLDFQEPRQTKMLSLEKGSVFTGFWMMIKQGMIHIWIGIDHILFLLALTLPAIMTFRLFRYKSSTEGESVEFPGITKIFNGHATYAKSFKPAFIYVLKIITFFIVNYNLET